jgi:hypothetical protein
MSASTDITTHAGVRGMRIDWTPYVMGAGIGVRSWIVFVFADDPLGVTTALSAVAGFAAMPFTGADAVWHNSYWAQTVPSLSYGSIFLVGVVLGAFAASVAARQFHVETVPAVWRRATRYRFALAPPSSAARWKCMARGSPAAAPAVMASAALCNWRCRAGRSRS